MPDVEQLDAIVIGTGQGGKPLAGALAEAGWRCAIVERDRVGGTCVVRGCTPTKTMLASARIAHLARRAHEYGVDTGPVSVDLEVVRGRKRNIVDEWSSSSQRGLERHESLELVFGDARFTGSGEVDVSLNGGGERRLMSDHVFVNVGARNRAPELPGLDTIDYLDSTSLMELAEIPEHLIVLGGGFIGLEFGQMFRRFGADVTIVDRKSLASREDPDVSEAIEEILEGEGVRVVRPAVATHVARHPEGVAVTVDWKGEEEILVGSHVMIAIGTTPNTDTLGLEAAGVEMGDRGQIVVNDRCETNVPGICEIA